VLLKRLRMIEARRAREAEWAATLEARRAGLLTHDAATGDPVMACDATIDAVPAVKAVRDGE